MGLLDWFQRDKESDDKKPKRTPAYRPELGSGWTPGQSGSSLWPDSARPIIEKGSDGVTRLRSPDSPGIWEILERRRNP